VIVRLLRSYGVNTSGDVCGFSDSEAKRLIALGVALPFEAPAEPKIEAEVSPPVDKMMKRRR
jgi:hypothetical protein